MKILSLLFIITFLFPVFSGCSNASEASATVDTEQEKGWKITEYPCESGNVGLFYSMLNLSTGELILVDSGNPENAQTVSNVIDENGGHVDTWILTHYHNDHIGAFLEVYDQYKEAIDHIYVTPMDYDLYVETAHEWDRADVFASFIERTKEADNISEWHRGDEFDLLGLHVQVFNAFDDIVKEKSTDIHNDCSLVFKISPGEGSETMLFMGDLSRAGVELGQYILDTYGIENVRADYIQAGHHGNWGQPIAFYEQLMPKEIFLDAPEGVLTGEEYDAKDLLAWCEEQGITTHDYRQAPYSFVLK